MTNKPQFPESHFRPTRRNLLSWISGAAAGGVLAPQLAAQKRPGRPIGLPQDPAPAVVWDIALPNGMGGGQGSSTFLNGQIAFTSELFAGELILQDVQTGQVSTPTPSYAGLGNAVAIGSKVYYAALRLLSGNQIFCYDTATKAPPIAVYTTGHYGLLSAKGRYLYFIDNKSGSNHMACFDTVANSIVWSIDGQNTTNGGSSPAVTDDVVVYSLEDRVVGVDPAEQQVLWTYPFSVGSNNALPQLVTADGNVYFTANNVLYGLNLRTGTGWRWAGTSTLSDPVVYNGVIFVGDAAGKLNGIQGAAGGPVAPGSAAWPALPLGGDLSGPIFIEDGIAYCANNSVVAVDLTSAQLKSLSYAAPGPITKLNGVENGVAYFSYNKGARMAAVDIGQQLHEFFCESQLMADDYVASTSQAAGYQPANPRYRTHVRLLDPDSNPRVNKSVKVWASDQVAITSSGTTYQIGPANPAWLQTDNSGELEIISTANDISTPALYLWGTFMDQQEAIVIYPDHSALTKLSNVKDSDLAQGKTFDGNDLLTNMDGSSALANTITNTLGGVAQSLALTRTQNTRHNRGRRRPAMPGTTGDPNSYIAFPHSTPNMVYQATAGNTDRVYVRSNTPNWSTVINADGTMSFQPSATRLNLGAGATLDFAAFVTNVARGASNVSRVVANTADAVYHTITDELGRIYRFAVDTVEKAVAVVSSILKTVLKDIMKAVEWLAWLFNWDDILATKDAMKALLTQNATKLKTWLQTQQSNSGDVHQTMQKISASNGTDAASAVVAGKTFQSVQVDGNDPQATYGASGAASYTPSKSLQSKVSQNSDQGTVDAPQLPRAGSSDNILAAAQVFITTVESKLATDFKMLGGDLEKMVTDFKLLIADPNQFVKSGIGDLIQLAKDLAKTLLDFIDAVLDGFITMLAQIIDDILDLVNAKIHIPVISELWQLISHDPLTVLDLCALLVAVPVTIVEKAISGVRSAPGAPPPLNQNLGFAFAGSFSLVFDGLTDLLDLPDVGVEAYVVFGLGLLTRGFNFPDNEIGSPDGNQLLLYASSWFPVAFSSVLFAAAKAKSPLKKKLSDATPIVNFAYGATQLVMSSWIGVIDTAYAGKDHLGMISGILASVPYLAKVAATGEALSPQRVVVSVIDGVFESTSLGLSMAS